MYAEKERGAREEKHPPMIVPLARCLHNGAQVG